MTTSTAFEKKKKKKKKKKKTKLRWMLEFREWPEAYKYPALDMVPRIGIGLSQTALDVYITEINLNSKLLAVAHRGILENWVLLMNTLERESSIANFIPAYEESQ